MRVLPKRGEYVGPVAYDGLFHYPAAKAPGVRVREFRCRSLVVRWRSRYRGMARHRLVRVEPFFEDRNAIVDEALRHNLRNLTTGVIESDSLREQHDELAPDTGRWEFLSPRKHGELTHRDRFHRRDVSLEVGDPGPDHPDYEGPDA